MIQEGKTYTYEELQKLYLQAQKEVLEELDNYMEEVQQQTGREDQISKFMFKMQNMLVMTTMHRKLFVEEER